MAGTPTAIVYCMIKRLIRKLKYRLGPTEVIYDNGPLDQVDTKLLMDRDVGLTICSYDKNRGVYVVIVKPVNQQKDF